MLSGASKKTRSPLKDKPLNTPGESLDREIEHLFEDEAMPLIFLMLWGVLLAGWEWWRWFFSWPPQPAAMTFAALLLIGYSAYKLWRLIPRLRSMQQGFEGEKDVGQELEHLRAQGCDVLHDIPGDGFNIDHVVVSAHGIFVIETKTFSKPIKGDVRVEFDGECIRVNGHTPDRDPVRQALALRDWLQKFLRETTAWDLPVKAVVVFPGWFVENTKPRTRNDLWVLNPKGLPKFIENEPVVLKPEDVALVSSRLALHVRQSD